VRTFIKIATFNVRNLIQPGVRFYGRNRYSQGAYDRKIEWLADQLVRMDADVVGFQEVFDEASINDLLGRYHELLTTRVSRTQARRRRYVDSWHLPNADATDTNPLPGLALFSRTPILERFSQQDLTDEPIEIDPSMGLAYSLNKLSRPQMAARLDLGQGVDGWVFNAHLKSKRPLFRPGSQANDPEQFQFLERAQASFRSLALRAGEALALRRAVLQRVAGSDVPVIVLGDLNDEIGAVTTEMVAGEMPFRGWSRETKERFWDVELYSAVRSHLRRSEEASIYTHIFNSHYSTLDHVLVSQEFFFRNPGRIGDVNFVQVFNDHLTDNNVSGAPSIGDASDHGQVAVRLSIDSERLMARRTGEYELYRDDGGKWRFRLKAANGRVIADSQAYRSRSDALAGIDSVRRHATNAELDEQ
jgi:uncharacterized protein YegP (UPF0339 family)/endonuclease/exonuclease/phosphatase family metal-dependent hydrolase